VSGVPHSRTEPDPADTTERFDPVAVVSEALVARLAIAYPDLPRPALAVIAAGGLAAEQWAGLRAERRGQLPESPEAPNWAARMIADPAFRRRTRLRMERDAAVVSAMLEDAARLVGACYRGLADQGSRSWSRAAARPGSVVQGSVQGCVDEQPQPPAG
jgi:hypothetical protein